MRGDKGFSLLELIASIAIFSIGILTLATLFPAGITETKNIKDYTKAIFLGQAKMEEFKAKGFNNLPSDGATGDFSNYCADVVDHANDYNGYRWSYTEVNSGVDSWGFGAKKVNYADVELTVYWPTKTNQAYDSTKHASFKFKRFFCGPCQ